MKTKLGSAALLAVMAVIAIKTPLFACYQNEMMPPRTFGSPSPACELVGTRCRGYWYEIQFPAYPHCTYAQEGGDDCELYDVQVVAVVTNKECVYNELQEDCLLGFTETEVEILNSVFLLASGSVCPEPTEEPGE